MLFLSETGYSRFFSHPTVAVIFFFNNSNSLFLDFHSYLVLRFDFFEECEPLHANNYNDVFGRVIFVSTVTATVVFYVRLVDAYE